MGPGSWKSQAYWDEYEVSLRNSGSVPLRVESATLIGPRAEAVPAGDNPWKLERLSQKWFETNAANETSTYALLGAGTVVGGGVALATASAGIMGGGGGGLVVAGSVGAVAFMALPLCAVGTVAVNVHYKHRVEDEFARRRLVLPLTLSPGETARGSLFFRITPSPSQLLLRESAGGEEGEASVDLHALSGLHMRVPSTRGKLTSSKP